MRHRGSGRLAQALAPMMSRTCAFLLCVMVASCSLSREVILPDGTLRVLAVSPTAVRINNQVLTVSTAEFELNRLGRDSALKRIEILIPAGQVRGTRLDCEMFRRIALATGKEWEFYEWAPPEEETKKSLGVCIAVLG